MDAQGSFVLCGPWREALVVKFLGKMIGYPVMKDRLKKLWKLNGGFDMLDVDNGYYTVKFEQLADQKKVVSGGP